MAHTPNDTVLIDVKVDDWNITLGRYGAPSPGECLVLMFPGATICVPHEKLSALRKLLADNPEVK